MHIHTALFLPWAEVFCTNLIQWCLSQARSCKDLDLRPLQRNFRAFLRKQMLLFFLHSLTSKTMCEKVHDLLAFFLPTSVPMEPCCWNIHPTLSAQRRSTVP